MRLDETRRMACKIKMEQTATQHLWRNRAACKYYVVEENEAKLKLN